MTENKRKPETENTTAESNAAESSAAAKRAADTGGESVKETLNKAKDAAGEAATQAAGQVKEKAASLLGEQKSHLAAGINSVADSIRQAGEHLQEGDEPNQIAAFAGKYGDTLAEQVERVSHYVEDRDLRELVQDAEKFARRNPALFVGGAFALGILAARFLKSSGSKASASRRLKISDSAASSKSTAVQAS